MSRNTFVKHVHVSFCLFQASDTHSTSRILVGIVKMCFEAKNWDALNENIVLLTKKRGQIKQVKKKRRFNSLKLHEDEKRLFCICITVNIYLLCSVYNYEYFAEIDYTC